MNERINRGETPPKDNKKTQRAVVLIAVLTSLTTTFVGSATNLAIPDISGEFGVGAAAIGWIVTAYMLPVATFSVPFGRIADLMGRKKILILVTLMVRVCSRECLSS